MQGLCLTSFCSGILGYHDQTHTLGLVRPTYTACTDTVCIYISISIEKERSDPPLSDPFSLSARCVSYEPLRSLSLSPSFFLLGKKERRLKSLVKMHKKNIKTTL
ncbi:hypothetical protein PanWU01x14_005900 [Parasponia andersonii]|uniref:Uncharacterized protein n=1 Tax=Parasponia andersonii TaxID=3476 RepID=A0A2P5E3P9_PARAD|nr:hypothetical protein PanWU01x14_005900 [Parasponia andersonii]